MDTIASRALLIAFNYVLDEEVKNLFASSFPDVTDIKLNALVDLAAGRPGFVLTLMRRDKEMI